MDRQYIDNQHVVARYLADQLSDADREAFEAYCLQHPEIYREMEAAARFKGGLAALRESAKLEPLLGASSGSAWFGGRRAAMAASIAAAFAIAGAWYALRPPIIGATVAQVSGRFHAELPVSTTYELIRMRDSNELDAHVQLPTVPTAIAFRVLPDEEDATSYRATLSLESASGLNSVATEDGLPPDAEHYVFFYVNSAKLPVGTYSLTVVPESRSSNVAAPAFRFDVIGQQ